ncbi:hypothetical protein SK128_001287 [Halocaridina rubra]|uniref:Uncharacterized protein n=1 Tax=Halocaridina rubra TaxID=373956 RepID=A0AAN9AA95_HALRR
MKHLLLYLKELMKDYKNEVKEILAGDKQLAKEIEFDLRRFDQEQREDEEALNRQPVENEKSTPLHPQQDSEKNENNNDVVGEITSSTVLAHTQSLGTSYKLPSRHSPGTVPKTPSAARNELHRLAMMNSKAFTARRKSFASPLAFNIKLDTDARSSTGSHNSEANHSKKSNRDNLGDVPDADNTHIDSRPVATYPLESRKNQVADAESEATVAEQEGADMEKDFSDIQENRQSEKELTRKLETPQKTKEDLMRAISTPHKHGVIDNITFANETQEMSIISMNATVTGATEKQPTLILHLRSPEAYAQESDFSKLRRSNKSNAETKTATEKSSKQGTRQTKRGLFESYSSVAAENDSDDSDVSERVEASLSRQRTPETRVTGKRTRDMTSLSPDPKTDESSAQPISATKKLSKRRTKTKK